MPSSMPFYEVEFEVTAELGHGEVPFVAGTCPSLGNMDYKSAVLLTTTPDTYPIWRSPPLALPLHQIVLYKYGVFSGGEFKRWEEVIEDRVLDVVTIATAVPLITTGDMLDVEPEGAELPSTLDRALQDAERELDGLAPLRGSEALRAAGGGSRRASIAVPFAVDAGAPLAAPSLARRRSSMPAPTVESSISSYDGVVVVSFFLPVIVKRLEQGGWSVEWDYENLLSLHSSTMPLRVTRVGIVRGVGALAGDDEETLAKALMPFDCVPVFLERSLSRKFYRDFCKGILWPVFHHVVDVYGDLVMKFFTQLKDLWQCYTTVNRRFRDKIVEVYNEGDLIWVHGFHLLLLPSFLTRVLRVARIGLFLHTPFPSSEIFRTLPFREDLLRGMLNADQIGFHLFEYSRHFLTCCRRILGLNEGAEAGRARGTAAPHTTLFYNGRTVTIESIHAGIEPKVIEIALQSGQLDPTIHELKQQYKGRFVFVGIDKVERLKGLPLKLMAFERMLEGDPELAERVCLLQVGLSVHEREDDFEQSTKELISLATTINNKYSRGGRPVVVYTDKDEASFTLQQRLPYLCLADCLVNTAVRDGLNRLPLEFAIAHTVHRPQCPGVVMLSEFTSCMRVLRGAVRINPWKVDEVAASMAATLDMSLETRLARHAKDEDFVVNHTTSFWAYQVLKDLKSIQKSADRSIMSPVGLGLNFRVIGMDAGFSPLDNSAVMRTYRPAKHRIIFLDYGGTILPEEKQKDIMHYAVAAKLVEVPQPQPALKALLTRLCQDPRNTVFVISGREREAVLAGLGDIKGLGIAAEHGLYFHWPKPDRCMLLDGASGFDHNHEHTQGGYWETLVAVHDQSWKELTKTIMDIYVQRTHGTYIEEKGSAVLWQFRDADPEFGFLQSKELEDHLISVLTPFALEVLRGGGGSGGGYLEVRPQGVNKGAFVDAIIERMIAQGTAPDFVLALGDEASDEVMFTSIEQFKAQMEPTTSSLHCYTCTVGKKPTEAASYVNDIEEVHELLRGLAKVSTAVTRNYSTSALPEMQRQRDMFEEQSHHQRHLSAHVPGVMGRGQRANFHELSALSAEFHAAGSGQLNGGGMLASFGRSVSIATFMPTHGTAAAAAEAAAAAAAAAIAGGFAGLTIDGSEDSSSGAAAAAAAAAAAPMSPIHAAATITDYFKAIEEGDEENEDGIFF